MIDGASEARRRGRPRDPSRDAVILSTAFEMLTELGYDQLRVDDVARNARVGLSTMYRRWPTKAQLVVAALKHASEQASGTPTQTVRDHLEGVAATLRASPEFLPSIVNAMRREPELADTVREQLRRPEQERTRALIRERLPTDVDADTVRLIADLGPAIMFTRALIENEPPTTELVQQLDELIDWIVRARQAEARDRGR